MIKIITKTLKFSFLITIIYILSENNLSAQTYTLTTGTSWSVPPGVIRIRVECWGAGGGGPYLSSNSGGGGGGGGAYAMSELCVTSGTSYSYSIGVGGLGISGTNHGGDTWFSSTSTVLAQGGRGVANNTESGAAGGSVAGSVGTVRYAGGNGGNGYNSSWFGRAGGGGGGAATSTANGGDGGHAEYFFGLYVGAGGTSIAPGGNGGTGATNNNNGNSGNNYGGGGSGSGRSSGNRNGGDGAQGVIRITVINVLPLALDAGTDVTVASAGDNVTLGGSINPVSLTGISYTQDFSGCNSNNCNNWLIVGGNSPSITATTGTGYSPCISSNPAAKSNIYSTAPLTEIRSTTSIGISSGAAITFSFSAKAINYSNGNATAAGACMFYGFWSVDGVVWNQINMTGVSNLSSTSCNTYSFPTFSPPNGTNVYIGILAERVSGDFWVVMDDINVTQPNTTLPISWSGGPIVSGGSTTTPTVNPDETTVYTITSSIGGCPVTDNVTVTVTSPLAVTLSNFSASCDNKTITWATASEQNSSHFVVEQSRNGYEWSQIARVEGAGTTNVTNNYQINDNLSANYYRLKQVDFDGKFEYYGPIHIDCRTETHELTVYPNPTNGTFTVAITSTEKLGESVIFINDLSGKTVAVRDINILSGTNTVQLENNNMMPGTYIVSVKGKDKNTLIPIRLVVQ